MTWIRTAEKSARALEKGGITDACSVPGASIDPLHAALSPCNSTNHTPAQHVAGVMHMAEVGARVGTLITTKSRIASTTPQRLRDAIANSTTLGRHE